MFLWVIFPGGVPLLRYRRLQIEKLGRCARSIFDLSAGLFLAGHPQVRHPTKPSIYIASDSISSAEGNGSSSTALLIVRLWRLQSAHAYSVAEDGLQITRFVVVGLSLLPHALGTHRLTSHFPNRRNDVVFHVLQNPGGWSTGLLG